MARKNLEKFGLMGSITLKGKDAKEGIEETDLDAALIDMGDPWELVKNVKGALAPSAMMAAICPTMNQAEKLTERMKEEGFVTVETVEILMRNLEGPGGDDAAIPVHGGAHVLRHLRTEDGSSRREQARPGRASQSKTHRPLSSVRVLIRPRDRWPIR